MNKRLSPSERSGWLRNKTTELVLGNLTKGELLKNFREEILGLNQDEYAGLVKVSRKTISDIEGNKGDKSVVVYNKVFKPLGLHMNLVPTNKQKLRELLS